ncbi:hypothetical protein [Butyrivibrio sp. LC3010]|nr:hypothetical protein [Butyrivibrio sp. LC3010]
MRTRVKDVTVQTALRTCCAERENVLRLEYRICPFAEGNWNGQIQLL